MGCQSCKAAQTRGDPHGMNTATFYAPSREGEIVDFRAQFHERRGPDASPSLGGGDARLHASPASAFRRGPTSPCGGDEVLSDATDDDSVGHYGVGLAVRAATPTHTALRHGMPRGHSGTPRSVASHHSAATHHRAAGGGVGNGSFAGSAHSSDGELVLVCADCGAEVFDETCVAICPVSGKQHF